MTETLLSPSGLLLFGRVVEDLDIIDPRIELSPSQHSDVKVKAASTANSSLSGVNTIDGVPLKKNDRVLLKDQTNTAEMGVYQYVEAQGGNPSELKYDDDIDYSVGMIIKVRKGSDANRRTFWEVMTIDGVTDRPLTFQQISAQTDQDHQPFPVPRTRGNKFLESQLLYDDACFARIYGFSFEGTYYELPRPTLFLVHGRGTEATEYKTGKKGKSNPARAPGDPSLTGLAAADFDYADDLKVWSYDKADYTIRLDLESGMFEQVLLDMFFGDGGGVSGGKVSGGKVSGGKVSGGKVSGGKLSGTRLSGWRGDASD